MKKLITLMAVSLFVVATSSCALLSKVPGGNVVNNVGDAAVNAGGQLPMTLKEGGDRAKVKCDPILTAGIAVDEEKSMGGSVQVKEIKAAGGLFLTGTTATDPGQMMTDINGGNSKKYDLPTDPKNDLAAQVALVGRNLARYSERPGLNWTFSIVKSDTPNAASAPGGYVIVTTGLLAKVQNEAQLAGVLAHEIAHIVKKHSINRYAKVKHVQCVAATAGGYVVAKLGESIVSQLPGDMREAYRYVKNFENFDLDQADGEFVRWFINKIAEAVTGANDQNLEFEADAMAVELVAFAGYDASEYEKFLTSLGNTGGFLSSHPATTDRVAKMKALREGDLAPFATGTAKPDFTKYTTAALKK